MSSMLDAIGTGLRRTLDEYGFDPELLERLRDRLRDGTLSPQSNIVRGKVEPPAAGDVVRLPRPDAQEYSYARAAGLVALRSGAVASVVLNGGMATRFGGVVKGVVEAVGGRSFLELKLRQAEDLSERIGAEVPTAVMTSFATDAPTRKFLADRGIPAPLYFSQYVSLRLRPDGELFRTAAGELSPYAPGHGDFLRAFSESGTLDALRERGVRYVMVSNVDNLFARLDPVVLGMHIRAERPMTAEVAKSTGSPGGAPARVDGRTMLLESMRFPPDFDQSRLPVVNVNTVTFDLEALDRDFDLTWLYVEKKVDGEPAVQIEHLFHEASAFLPTTYLEVPVTGPSSRFLPIKTPADLETAQGPLRALLKRPPLD
jgi:UTP--glucose-1-phosphate uridylyltransferase